MIEVKVNFSRETIPVFLIGEMVEIFVNFTNPGPEEAQAVVDENLAWASVQITCFYCSTLQKDSTAASQPSTSTSLNVGETGKGDIQHSTKPKILFCDIRLPAGETKTYCYREQLSFDAPPTYRGVNIKFFYKITIATQRVGSKVQTLNIPIRVLPLPASMPEEIGALCDETSDELPPSNPFQDSKKKESYLEVAMEFLQNITARRRPNFYVISNMRGRVGRFCLFKSDYRIGEDIVGTLDFTERTVKCVQFLVTLQSEEFMVRKKPTDDSDAGDIAAGGSDTASVAGPSTTTETPANGKITSYSKHHDMCLGFMQTQMILPIPLHVTPSFAADKVEVRWKLHFEFVTTTNKLLNEPVTSDKDWRAPSEIEIETMIWNLPVKIYATNPLQMPQTKLAGAVEKLVIQ